MWWSVQLSRHWLTDWHPAHHCRHKRSLDLRLFPHVIGRGEHFFRSASGLHLIHQEQIEYIWSGKISFRVSFLRVLNLGTAALTDCQFSCYLSWYGHLLCDSTSGSTSDKEQILASMAPAVDVHRWVSTPVSSLLPPTLPLDPKTAYFSPVHTKQVCKGCCDPEILLTSLIRRAFHDVAALV